ncbi:MAG: DnaD domain protein [Anaerolineae bacterium]|nr:DnaD domain protein [Anaerolineae bacterium]
MIEHSDQQNDLQNPKNLSVERVMHHFSGFSEDTVQTLTLPDPVFTEVMPLIDDLAELQVTLLTFRRLALLRSNHAPWITRSELRADVTIQATLESQVTVEVDVEGVLDYALARAVARGTLLLAEWTRADGMTELRYLANSPRGRAAVAAMKRGIDPARASIPAARPNIFTLYEQNIGSLTALLSEDLMEAEQTYPVAWIEEAFQIAVRRNVRNWNYIHAILERWQTEGKDEEDRRSRETDTRRYIEGEYGHLIQH